MSYHNDEDGKNMLFAFVLTIALAFLVFWLGVKHAKAEQHDLRKDCYLEMSQQQVLVCLESMRVAVEDMAEQTKELLADIKPVNTES